MRPQSYNKRRAETTNILLYGYVCIYKLFLFKLIYILNVSNLKIMIEYVGTRLTKLNW